MRSPGGLVTLVAGALAAASCQSSPVAPTASLPPGTAGVPSVSNVAGEWRVVYHVAAACLYPEQDDATLPLQDAGGTLRGTVTLLSVVPDQAP
ncbi:MAG: hypothetical protein AB7O28_06725 [Vicinamibacterales bacterium]